MGGRETSADTGGAVCLSAPSDPAKVRDHVVTMDLPANFAGTDRVRPGFLQVRGEVTLDTPASDADVERLRRMVEKHCPVLDDLRAPVPVTMEVVRAQGAAKSAVG